MGTAQQSALMDLGLATIPKTSPQAGAAGTMQVSLQTAATAMETAAAAMKESAKSSNEVANREVNLVVDNTNKFKAFIGTVAKQQIDNMMRS